MSSDEETVQHRIFSQFPEIKGSVTEPGYEGWVELQSCQWGAGQRVTSSEDPVIDEDGNPDETKYAEWGSSNPRVLEICVSKPSGPESGKLLFNMVTNKGMDITIVFLTKHTTPTNPNASFIRTGEYVLHHTLFSGFSRSSRIGHETVDSCINETISLNYGGFESMQYDLEGEPVDAVMFHLHTGTTTYKTWNAEKRAWEVVIIRKKVAELNND